MTNISPWKDPPFLRTVNHLFRLGPSIPWRTVSHSQVGFLCRLPSHQGVHRVKFTASLNAQSARRPCHLQRFEGSVDHPLQSQRTLALGTACQGMSGPFESGKNWENLGFQQDSICFSGIGWWFLPGFSRQNIYFILILSYILWQIPPGNLTLLVTVAHLVQWSTY